MIRAMSDRGNPSADGAVACPFVAFDDDRDARSTAPDHRHRCFAEPVPAPRAIAHQDAYCLSPAFAVCPAFQDWARREAAAARPAPTGPAPASRPREEDTSGPVPLPPVEREPRHAPSSSAQPLPARKSPSRDWAAPPPWVADSDAEVEAGPAVAPGAIPGWGAAAVGGVAAAGGSAARAREQDEWGDAARGLADSPAARLAGPDLDLPAPARPVDSWASSGMDDEDPDDDAAYDAVRDAPPVPPARPQQSRDRGVASRPGSPPAKRPVPPPQSPSSRDGARPALREAEELFGPAWERPRRYEAYPSLRTRVGLPSFGGIPRIGIAAIALVAAAAFLFFVSPMILGLGGSSGSSPAPSELASAAPSESAVPTVPPAPTAYVYTVVKGDTLSKIAAKNNTNLKALLAANPQIKNPNSIKIGDQITIPAPSGESVGGASPSVVAGASAGP
jgi:LysM repeat protein